MGSLLSDVRYGVRMLLRAPTPSAIPIALGVGAD
jgi:hypothetical protein